jgi:diacylglycerol kinase family enzyme
MVLAAAVLHRCAVPVSNSVSGRIPVLINAGGGTAASKGDTLEAEVRAAFESAGVKIDLQLLHGGEMQAAVAERAHLPLVVVGGGDGTIACAATEVLKGKAALGILALGTRNHLARELGVPLDLSGAAELIAAGPQRRIDIGRVNGRLFINNASIGLYPAMVRLREKGQEQANLPKWVAAIPASWRTLKRLPHHRVRLRMPDKSREVVTPMLFVGNNHYELDAGQLGKRSALDGGTLSVFAVAARGRIALIGFALRTLIGRVDRAQDFAAIGDMPKLSVTGRSRQIDIALDGEVARLSMPLDFTIEAGALVVVAPAEK